MKEVPWSINPNRNTIHNLVNKVRTTGMLICKKPNCLHQISIEEGLNCSSDGAITLAILNALLKKQEYQMGLQE
jgi:hypothetical protein